MNSFSEGRVILIDKPYRWTSFDVVNKIKGLIQKSTGVKLKIGHAGTLDPLATGLLILCTGKFTKRIEEFQAKEKEYLASICLGASTPCFDLEQPIDQTFPTEHISEDFILEASKKFTGTQLQVPPVFSAIKLNGKRAYELAREGKTPEIAAKTVSISEFAILGIRMPTVDCRVVCSKGTYIRSLARDFGTALGSGAHLSALRRTRIGEFSVEDAQNLEKFEESLKNT